ncbi:MAG: response regulator [Oscillospiraceae bacterium]
MLKIAACDDDKQERARIDKLLQAYQVTKKEELICVFFDSGVELLSDIKSNDYDLILLDIVMPGLNGIQVAKELRLFNSIIQIVLLSDSSEFVVDSYAVGAYGYLLKPIVQSDLFCLLDKLCIEVTHRDKDSLVIKSHEGIVRIPFFNLEYVEVMNKIVSFHLTDGSVRDASASLLDFEPQLLSRVEFLKVHRSYLINLRYIQTLNAKVIVTQAGHSVPISRLLYAQVKESYMKYLFTSRPKMSTASVTPVTQPFSPPASEHENCEYRILLVDDELEQQNHWAHVLQENGCAVDLACNVEVAECMAPHATYDCVILDVMLFGEISFSHCQRLRELTNAPVVFLSSLTDNDSQLQGFISGGIDYITKDTPVDLFWAKILARIRLTRTGKAQLSFSTLVIDLSLRKVLVEGVELMLTPTEFDLLWVLAEHAGRVYTPEELYHAVWGTSQWDGGQSIQVHMSRMRRKLEKACQSNYFIETAWGKGYRFVPNHESAFEQRDANHETV